MGEKQGILVLILALNTRDAMSEGGVRTVDTANIHLKGGKPYSRNQLRKTMRDLLDE